MSKFIEEGWKFLIDDEKLMLISKNSKEFSYPIHKIKSSDSKYDIFWRFLPHSLLSEILNKMIRKGGLSFNKGNGRFYTIEKNMFIPLHVFAVKILIQGLQNKALPKQRAITNAVNQLKTKAPHIPCASMMK